MTGRLMVGAKKDFIKMQRGKSGKSFNVLL